MPSLVSNAKLQKISKAVESAIESINWGSAFDTVEFEETVLLNIEPAGHADQQSSPRKRRHKDRNRLRRSGIDPKG